MVMVFKFGQMELNMKVIGRTTKLVEKGNFTMLMVMFLKVSGKMIKQMDLVFIDIVMEQFMKVVGNRISNMGMVQKHGQTILRM